MATGKLSKFRVPRRGSARIIGLARLRACFLFLILVSTSLVLSESVFVNAQTLRSTSTSVSCVSPVLVDQASTCTVTVRDTASGSRSAPGGSVTFTSTGVSGVFQSSGSPPSCPLSPSGSSSATCNIGFKPLAFGTASITATYVPTDPIHSGSTSLPFSISDNMRITSTVVTCTSPVGVNEASTCTVNVSDTSSPSSLQTAPTGTVTFTSSTPGAFGTGAMCTLSSSTISGPSICTVSFTPSVGPGTASITGNYQGDMAHCNTGGGGGNGCGSSSTSPGTINILRTTMVSETCNPTLNFGIESSCTVTVSDISAGGPSTPLGAVNFGGSSVVKTSTCGTLSAVSGSPSRATCTVTLTPNLWPETFTFTYAPTDSCHAGSSSSVSVLFIMSGGLGGERENE